VGTGGGKACGKVGVREKKKDVIRPLSGGNVGSKITPTLDVQTL